MNKITWGMVSDLPDPDQAPPPKPDTPNLIEYAFDITLAAAIRVMACDEADARRQLEEKLDAADTNFGAWDNGDPILAEASLRGTPTLFEVDGETVE